jgi:competence protein ComEC
MTPSSSELTVYVLNVGQADTSVIRTPGERIIVIDAVCPPKLRHVLERLDVSKGGEIEALVITHPHHDHYRGGGMLLDDYDVRSVYLAPFWYEAGWGAESYKALFNRIEEGDSPVYFVAGYGRVYPDDFATDQGESTEIREDVPYLELLGPPNGVLAELERHGACGTNHLSVMARLTWKKFSMVFAADAQMENWASFDREGMLDRGCDVLKAAHHGSKNGTQWERLARLEPGLVIVSSEPYGQHHIPDAIGCAVLKEYQESGKLVTMTRDAGTVEVVAKPTGSYKAYRYQDGKSDDTLNGAKRKLMRSKHRLPHWGQLLEEKLERAGSH